jgi:hypothetical protein
VTRRSAALVAAAVVAVALWLGAASPGLASATEAPSPPALGAVTACAGGRVRSHPAVWGCPAAVRSSSSAVVTSAARRLPAGVPGPVAALVVVAATGVVALLAVRRPPGPIPGRNGARAPPLPAS